MPPKAKSKPKTKPKSKPRPRSRAKGKGKPRSRPRSAKAKWKRNPKGRVVRKKIPKVTPKTVLSFVPKNKTGSAAVEVFPMENVTRPNNMRPTDITRLYKIPNENFETEGDVIAYNGYMLEEKLDAGGFGMIFFARSKRTSLRVACKLMDIGDDWEDERVTDMKNELFIMEKVKHLYVVKLFTHFLTQSTAGNRIFIFMELADGGNFAKFCQKKGALGEDDSKLYLAQIICGLNHMHSLGVAHRDIKPQNILLKSNEKSVSGDFTLLVADFGLSRILRHDAGGHVALVRTICGTPIFMSPELLLRKPYNAFLVDLWALGILLFIMVTLELPFDFRDEDAVVKDMVTRNWSWPEDRMQESPSEQLNELMKALLEPESARRLTMAQLCTHKWISADYQKAQMMANRNGKG